MFSIDLPYFDGQVPTVTLVEKKGRIISSSSIKRQEDKLCYLFDSDKLIQSHSMTRNAILDNYSYVYPGIRMEIIENPKSGNTIDVTLDDLVIEKVKFLKKYKNRFEVINLNVFGDNLYPLIKRTNITELINVDSLKCTFSVMIFSLRLFNTEECRSFTLVADKYYNMSKFTMLSSEVKRFFNRLHSLHFYEYVTLPKSLKFKKLKTLTFATLSRLFAFLSDNSLPNLRSCFRRIREVRIANQLTNEEVTIREIAKLKSTFPVMNTFQCYNMISNENMKKIGEVNNLNLTLVDPGYFQLSEVEGLTNDLKTLKRIGIVAVVLPNVIIPHKLPEEYQISATKVIIDL